MSPIAIVFVLGLGNVTRGSVKERTVGVLDEQFLLGVTAHVNAAVRCHIPVLGTDKA